MRTGGRRPPLLADRRGLSSVEYVLILVLVAAVGLVAWRGFGGDLTCTLARVERLFAETLGVAPREGAAQCELAAVGEEGDTAAGSEDGTARTVGDRAGGKPGGGGGSSGSGKPGGGKPGSGGGKPGGAGSGGKPPPLSPADVLVRDVLAVMCPKDKAFLQDLKARGVKITAYDRIYFDDPYYDGKKWTTKRFEAGGTTSGTEINMIRSSRASENAATIYHEGVHTGQPGSMEWRDKEYDAYIKEDQWRISHGLPPHDASFRKRDAAGNETTDPAAVRAFVDKEYPGVTSTPSAGGPPEQVIGRTPSGQTKVRRADGTEYTRPPKRGDSFAGKEVTVPKGGIPIDINKLQCP